MRLEAVAIWIKPYIVFTKDVPYTRNGKSFIRKVKLKEPEAHCSASYQLLVHDAELVLRGVYIDNLGTKWMCVSVTRMGATVCCMRSVKTFVFEDELEFPTSIALVQSYAGEYVI